MSSALCCTFSSPFVSPLSLSTPMRRLSRAAVRSKTPITCGKIRNLMLDDASEPMSELTQGGAKPRNVSSPLGRRMAWLISKGRLDSTTILRSQLAGSVLTPAMRLAIVDAQPHVEQICIFEWR